MVDLEMVAQVCIVGKSRRPKPESTGSTLSFFSHEEMKGSAKSPVTQKGDQIFIQNDAHQIKSCGDKESSIVSSVHRPLERAQRVSVKSECLDWTHHMDATKVAVVATTPSGDFPCP